MVEIEKPRITCLDSVEDPSYGKYVVEPLERGYGMTLGNSLRRILLSSLPGYAATSVKIQGATKWGQPPFVLTCFTHYNPIPHGVAPQQSSAMLQTAEQK